MKLIYFKSSLKCDSFDVGIGIKIPFFRVLVTMEPGRSLLQFVTTNCLTRAESSYGTCDEVVRANSSYGMSSSKILRINRLL